MITMTMKIASATQAQMQTQAWTRLPNSEVQVQYDKMTLINDKNVLKCVTIHAMRFLL